MRSRLAQRSFQLAIALAAATTTVPALASEYWNPQSTPANAIWSSGAANFNPAPDGTGSQVVWTAGNVATFSASSFTVDPYTVTVSGTDTAIGMVVQSGTVTFAGTSSPILRVSNTGIVINNTVSGPIEFGASLNIINLVASSTTVINNLSSQLVTFDAGMTPTKTGVTGVNTVTFGGSGTGGFVFNGSILDGANQTMAIVANTANASVFLSGAKTYSSGTTIENGTVLIDNAASLGNVASSVIFDNGGSGTPVLKLAGNVVTSRPITLTTTGTIDTGGFNFTYGGTTTGSAGLIKKGNGALLVNGTIGGPMTVSGGSLGGTGGTVSGAATIQATGTLAPGASIGTLNFGSTLTLQGDAAFEIDPDDLTADLATGITTLIYGGTLHVSDAGDMNNFAAGQTFKLFDAAAVTSGDYFTLVSLPTLPDGLDWKTFSGTGENDQPFDYATGEIVVEGSGVPEPASLALLGMGAAALLTRRNRKK